MKSAIVGIDSTNNGKVYRLLVFDKQSGGWQFGKQMVSETQLIELISKKKTECLNATVLAGKLKGITGDLGRFENKINKPLVILAEIVTEDKITIGYKIANHDGVVKNIKIKELIGYCARITKNGGIPVQNGMYVPDKEGQKAHIRCYPGSEYLKEIVERKKSENAKPAVVDKAKNQKTIAKLEELFDKEQIKQLKLGKQSGVDIRIYGNPEIEAPKMKVLREMLEAGLNAKLVASNKFSVEALKFYKAEMKYGMDISYYVNPDFTVEQLSVLSDAYSLGLDMSKIADPKIAPEEMEEIKMRLENNIFNEHQVKTDDSWKTKK